MSGACFVVQCTHSDLLDSDYRPGRSDALAPDDPAAYAVGALLEGDLRPIVLAAPDLPANREALPALAAAWGVDLELGDEFNVIRRLLAAAARHEADVIARLVMPSFYADPEVIRAQLAQLRETGADYCVLPRDVNVNFGADVVTVAALRRFDELVEDSDEDERRLARYRPWPFLERLSGDFAVTVCETAPRADAERIRAIRSHPNWPERAGPGVEGGEYRALARDYLHGDEEVLDAGCGHGEISSILSEFAGRVTGVDYDPDIVEVARQRFPEIRFEPADLQTWTRPEAFDVIFHCHTLEHTADPVRVLSNLRASLRNGGRLIVEVPLELRPGVVNPHHEREYDVDELRREIAAAGLRIEEERGVFRGVYGQGPEAREAYLAVCVAGERS